MKKKARTYRIMMVPERDGNRAVSFQVSGFWIPVLVTVMALVLVASVFLIHKSAQVARKLYYCNTLQSNNERLLKENKQLYLVHTKIMHMDSIAAYLEQLSMVATLRTNDAAAVKSAAVDGKTKPAAKTTAMGTKADSNDNGAPSLMPVEGWTTQKFTKDTTQNGGAHPGIDIAAPAGMIIKAPAAGTVIAVLQDIDYGTMVVLRHEEGFVTRYGHCQKSFVSADEKVDRGQTIALVGNTGRSSAPHLHYEVIKDGKNVDPQHYITPREKTVK